MASSPRRPPASRWRGLFAAQRRETRRIIAELDSVRGLMPLLMKVRNGGRWTAEERSAVLEHLRRMAHLSPYLLALLLPGSFVLLPIYAWWLDRRRRRRQGPGSAQTDPLSI